jgi:hypothetical protein
MWPSHAVTPRNLRLIDWSGLNAGHWIHPVTGSISSDGFGWRFNFGFGNPVTRIRFGNPNDEYPNIFGGQWRMFNATIPWDTELIPLTDVLPAATLWLPC